MSRETATDSDRLYQVKLSWKQKSWRERSFSYNEILQRSSPLLSRLKPHVSKVGGAWCVKTELVRKDIWRAMSLNRIQTLKAMALIQIL
jgi:hypothetical protein